MSINTILLSVFYVIFYLSSSIWNMKNNLKHIEQNSLNFSNYYFDEVLMPILNQSIESKTVNSYTKKLLRKTLAQNEHYNKEFNECYENLSKFIRLLLTLNKNFDEKEKKKITGSNNNNIDLSDTIKKVEYETGKNFMSLKFANILQNELNIYLLVNFSHEPMIL
jgi:hypothetical protein